MKKAIPILMLLFVSSAYAQSIGALPTNSVKTETWQHAEAYFDVSQGSEFPERITIEEDYDWLEVDQETFILESRSRKTVKLDIFLKEPGTHSAKLEICGTALRHQDAVLSTKACTNHELTVEAVERKKPSMWQRIAGFIKKLMQRD